MNDWGLKYIQIKADIYETTTAKRIRRKYGVEGLVAYIVLRLEIARNGYYLPWDKDTAADLADGALGISEECYRGVAEICAETGTFYREQYEKYHIITGPEMRASRCRCGRRTCCRWRSAGHAGYGWGSFRTFRTPTKECIF